MLNNPLANPHDIHVRPSPLPRLVQRLLVFIFLLGLVAAMVFALGEHWRRATFALGVCLLFLSALRWICDSQVLGVFAVRSRRFDSAFTAAIGGVMAFLAASVDSLGS